MNVVNQIGLKKLRKSILTGSHYTNKHVQNNDIKLKDDFGFRAILVCTGKSLRSSIWTRYNKFLLPFRSRLGYDRAHMIDATYTG